MNQSETAIKGIRTKNELILTDLLLFHLGPDHNFQRATDHYFHWEGDQDLSLGFGLLFSPGPVPRTPIAAC